MTKRESTTIHTFEPNQDILKRNFECTLIAVWWTLNRKKRYMLWPIFISSVGSEVERKRTILISDGVPYILALDIQDFVLNCSQCDAIVDTKGINKEEVHSFLHEHEMECLSDIPIPKRFTLNFKNLLLLLGLGHMELNEACILLKLL